jgi:parallel beta-helix repeat protein
VILSHSWGTVLTYIVLHEHPDIVVDKLITMGSPLESVAPGIYPVTSAALAFYQIFSVHSLPNIRNWNNYWAYCDPVSFTISAATNYLSDLSVLINGFCHSGYYEETIISWNNILEDAYVTESPLSITYTTNTSSAPGDVKFIATGSLTNGSNFFSFSWDFGDGATALGQTFTHFYKNPGNYPVTLTMTDSSGGTHVASESIIMRPPQIQMTYPNGFDTLIRQFSTPSNSYAKQYTWLYGDGSPTENGRSTDPHSFPTAGSYNVTLTLTLDDNSTVPVTEPHYVGPGTQYIQGHTVYYNETWSAGGTYVVQGSMSIAKGGKLTIESGAQIELQSGSTFNVSGTLIATEVKFTAQDQASPWGGIFFEGAGSTGSRLENCILEYAGYYYGRIIKVFNSSPTIKGCTIDKSSANYGIYIRDGSPVIQGNTINGANTLSYGIYVDGTSSPAVTGNTISNNQYGIMINGAGGTYQGNTLSGNTEYGLYYSGTSVIDVTSCDWGSPSGPLDDSDDRATGGLYNPNGKGNKVSDHVNYDPWIFNVTPGDVNHDGVVGLADAVLTLQILSGIAPTQPAFKDADVNGDGRLGTADVIYILQKAAGMR